MRFPAVSVERGQTARCALVLAGTLAVVLGGGTARAFDVVRLPGLGAAQAPTGAVVHTAAGLAKRAGTRLTLGLDTLAGEYAAFSAAAPGGARAPASFVSRKTSARIIGGSVLVDAVATGDPQALAGALRGLGAQVSAVAGRIVSARVPLEKLGALEGLGSLRMARPALARTRTGAVTSQGDAVQRSDVVRAAFGATGAGSMVGILSDSFDCLGGYAADVATRDLPAGVLNLSDYIEEDCTDEGRAMAQIVHDVAPGATLAFYTAFNGEADVAQGIRALAAAGAKVIVDDVGYATEPMFQDGVIAQAVDAVKADGVVYFSSAGNQGRQAYEAPFRPSGQLGQFDGELHDFDPGPGVVTRLTVTQWSDSTYILQWQDPFFSVSGGDGAATDIDVCFYSPPAAADPSECSAIGNQGGDPIEGLTLQGFGDFAISISRFSGPAPGLVKFVVWGDISFPETYAGETAAGALWGHPNAAGALAVGASSYFLTPDWGVSPPLLNYYSSAGKTPILFDIAGNPIADTREKPEFVAPDGGNTTFFYSDDDDDDDWPNFYGTSAAAPHAAGVAALMREVNHTLNPDAIKTALESTAIDIVEREDLYLGWIDIGAGRDDDSGHGLIDAESAVKAVWQFGDQDGDTCIGRNDVSAVLEAVRVGVVHPFTQDINRDGSVNRADTRALMRIYTHPSGNCP